MIKIVYKIQLHPILSLLPVLFEKRASEQRRRGGRRERRSPPGQEPSVRPSIPLLSLSFVRLGSPPPPVPSLLPSFSLFSSEEQVQARRAAESAAPCTRAPRLVSLSLAPHAHNTNRLLVNQLPASCPEIRFSSCEDTQTVSTYSVMMISKFKYHYHFCCGIFYPCLYLISRYFVEMGRNRLNQFLLLNMRRARKEFKICDNNL